MGRSLATGADRAEGAARTRLHPGWVVLALALGIAGPAAAQARAEPAKVTYQEVERGVWVGSNLGAIYFFDLPGEGAAASWGSVVGVEAGVDLGKWVQLGVVAWGHSVGAPADYRGITDDELDPKRSRGDFQSLLVGGSLRVAFLGFPDENSLDRTFVYARVAGGATLSRPVGIVDEQGTFAAAGLGVEYFTRLRHFSVGLELQGMGLVGDAGTALGVAMLPNLKYTF
ncbi:MAG TPA: adventurous gliding motility protein CglE [Vulgatibacter sp.]|nr:adventurous gliding motility protein CglE [Vulgatibacter sp.]